MIKFMHKHAKFFYVFFFLIIISFIFFYVGPIDKSSSVALIEIGDKKIYSEEYWRVYDNIKNYYSSLLKDKFNSEMEKTLNLKKVALDAIVEHELMLEAAKQLGINVSDREVSETILHDPTFNRDGAFRQDIYMRYIELNRMTPAVFEAKRREDLIVSKVRALIELTAGKLEEPSEDLKSKDKDKILEKLYANMDRERKAKLVKSYIDGLKKTIHFRVKEDLIG
ncbi:MAG: SurA N-terminal domain-containing protein [Nitrospirae bacterium]|nr:SurA N-terminal domain-containing protein [Nitrospirota bacterium]